MELFVVPKSMPIVPLPLILFAILPAVKLVRSRYANNGNRSRPTKPKASKLVLDRHRSALPMREDGLAKTLLHSSPQTVRRHCWRGLLTTVENRFKPGACTFSIVSDQAQTVPLGKAMLVHSRCFVTDPSGEDYRRRTVSEICGGYKAVKFRFLLFL